MAGNTDQGNATIVPPLDPASWTLERQCDTIAEYWVYQWGCVQLAVLKERGGDALAGAKQRILRRHQREYFLAGLTKLGISRDLPPAVIAARYHYFSNAIGKLQMEYIEESPKKVWIRYRAPSFSFTGVSLAAVPSKVQRWMFSGWHPYNGEALGCPNLGFVVTKVFQDGEPYDEGYFQEFDRPLDPNERIQYRPALMSPDFVPEAAPRLDPALWPDERRWRANRNFARAYLEDTVRVCLELYGVHETASHLAQAFRIFSVQFHDVYRRLLGVTGSKAVDLVALYAKLFEMANEAPVVTQSGTGRYTMTRLNRMFAAEDVPHEIYHAMFESVKLSARIMSARINVRLESAHVEPGKGVRETWTIEDTAERLF